MKNIVTFITIFAFCLASCSKAKDSSPAKTSLYIISYQKDNLTSDTSRHRVTSSISVWKDSPTNPISIKNWLDASTGIAYDSNNQKVNTDYFASDDHLLVNNISPGNYLIGIVNLYKYDLGYPLWTYKHIVITSGQSLELDKVFIYPGDIDNYQPW